MKTITILKKFLTKAAARSAAATAGATKASRSGVAAVSTAAVVAAMLTACGGRALPHDYDKLLADYDAALQHRHESVKRTERLIDSIARQPAATAEDSVRLFAATGRTYAALSLDSALHYLNKSAGLAERYGLDSSLTACRIDKASLLMRQGQDGEAFLIYGSIRPDSVPNGLQARYHYVGQQIGLTLFDRSSGHFSTGYFKEMGLSHSRQLLKLLPDTSALHELTLASYFKLNDKDTKQVSHLLSVVENDEASLDHRAIAEFWLAVYYLRRNGPTSDQAGRYLLRAATDELNAGKKSGLAMTLLGQWFYNAGDHDRCMTTWRIALENSRESSASNQWMEHRQLAATTFSEIDRHNRTFAIAIGAMVVMLLTALAVAFFVWRSHRRQCRNAQVMERRLNQLTQSKESFVSEFMNTVSRYMEGIETQNAMICRKISAGRSEDIVRSIKAGKFASDQNKILLEGFDTAFLNLYPDFVERVNELLEADKQLELTETGSLPTELRIMAFARLGIDDGARVARFLGVSVNTVYTYRNKVRSRAVNRETFDEQFMRICELQAACGRVRGELRSRSDGQSPG